jgi:sulfide:quinone oxidoreductase
MPESSSNAVASPSISRPPDCDILIVGGGSAGLGVAASLLRRRPGLAVTILEPSEQHYYQPGWTLLGAGVFEPGQTVRPTARLIPQGATWLKAAARAFHPEANAVELEDGRRLSYRILIAAPGLKLDWAGVPGLSEALGQNGVTSNYRYDLAPYTWRLVQDLKGGKALFTQPAMPIKCAGAPQKALYLSGDYWLRAGRLDNLEIAFHNAGAVLFGVKDYVPALMEYVRKYRANLCFESRLIAVDGPGKTATFSEKSAQGEAVEVSRPFDFIHVCPPQTAPDFVRDSPLAGPAGWIDVDDATLRHKRFDNIFALGDVCSAPNAKTVAAARKQAPIVAVNALAALDGRPPQAAYDGYGSCPLTVERGKIVLAEFGYGGKLLPTFPTWLNDGRKPTRLAWFLKERMLPEIYWSGMLKGREWLASPTSTMEAARAA